MASHIYKLAVHKVKEAETMANYFENTPKYSRWSAKSVLKAGFWGFAVPFAIYNFVLPAYNWSEERAGKRVINYSVGAEVMSEYGQGGGKGSRSRYTSL